MNNIQQPSDLLKLFLGKEVQIKLKSNIILKGNIKSYDEHSNLLVSNCYESIKENDRINYTKKSDLLFIRGDVIVMVNAN